MIQANVQHCKTLEDFYTSIRAQQEAAHGKDYCGHHDAIKRLIQENELTSYKELGTHQGATAAAALLSKMIRRACLIDIKFDIFEPQEPLFDTFCQTNGIELNCKCIDSSSPQSLDGKRYDIMLIDSLHKPAHMKKELAVHSETVNHFIVAHDTSKPSDSLFHALKDFVASNHKKWSILERNTTNVGYTILKRVAK